VLDRQKPGTDGLRVDRLTGPHVRLGFLGERPKEARLLAQLRPLDRDLHVPNGIAIGPVAPVWANLVHNASLRPQRLKNLVTKAECFGLGINLIKTAYGRRRLLQK